MMTMEKLGINIVYGSSYDKAESKVLIGQEVASRYLSRRYITVGKMYEEWLNAVVNRVKESTLANYKAKFKKHILPIFEDVPCADLSAGQINEYIKKARRRIICELCEGYYHSFQSNAKLCSGRVWF